MEDYKFVGFSRNFGLYVEAERHVRELIEKALSSHGSRYPWTYIEGMTEGAFDPTEPLRRRFAVSNDTVVVIYRSRKARKGISVQLDDPDGPDAGALLRYFGVPYGQRPADITAFTDESREPDDEDFSRDLVVICELSDRTEALIIDLVRTYIADNVTFDAMGVIAKEFREREDKMREEWKAARKLD